MAERAREADLQDGNDQERTVEKDSVGAMLARARRERGQEVADVAANLRIRRVYLQAIEERRYAELPGPTYAVGFVRSYAEYLQLDAAFLVERFKSEIAGLERKPSLHFPAPKPEGRVPGGALVVISVLLIALTYGGWYYANQNDVLDGLLSGEPERLATDVPDAPAGDQAAEGPLANGAGGDEASASQSTARATAEDDSGAEDRSTVQTPLPPLDRAAQAEATVQEAPQPVPGATEPSAAESDPAGPVESASEAGGDDAPPAEAASLSPPPEAATDVAAQPATPGTAERAPQAPGVAANSIEGDVAADGTAEPVTAAEPPAAEATAAEDAETEIATAATETIEPGIPDAPDLPTSANQNSGRVYGVANGESRVVLTATSDSWVQVRSADANLLITRVLRAGDIYRVPDQQGLTLETGNAGGLTVTVDGRTAPPLGRSGDVLRGVSLEPQALLSGQAAQ